jgi:glutamate racemase
LNPIAPPILLVDAGAGGLPVAAALGRMMPERPLVYVADTAGGPYCTKSVGHVRQRLDAVLNHFAAWRPRHVVITCATAGCVALDELRHDHPNLSISGVIRPAARAASVAAGIEPRPLFGVLTSAAAASRARELQAALGNQRPRSRVLLRAAPLLPALVEEGRPADDPLLRAAVNEAVGPLVERNVNVLMCAFGQTAALRQALRAAVGRDVKVIDSAAAVADDVAWRLGVTAGDVQRKDARVKLLATDEPARLARLAKRVLPGEPWLHVEPTLLKLKTHDQTSRRRAA